MGYPIEWLYGWYSGFVGALQAELGAQYTYENKDDFDAAWGGMPSIDGGEFLDEFLADTAGSALGISPVLPMTVDTDDGPKGVYATGKLISDVTSTAVTVSIDGFWTAIPWNTIVAEALMANNYKILPNKLQITCAKIASQITGRVITDTSNLYVTGKVLKDASDNLISTVKGYCLQGIINGAAAAGLLESMALDDYEIDEEVEIPEAPSGAALSVLAFYALTSAIINKPERMFDNADLKSLSSQISIQSLASAMLSKYDLTQPGWYNVDAFCSLNDGVAAITLSVCKILPSMVKAFKFTGHGITNNTMTCAVQDNNDQWYNAWSQAYGIGISNSIALRMDGLHDLGSVGNAFYSGIGFAYEGGSTPYDVYHSVASNILSKTVIAPEIERHDIDTWGPTREAHAIDELWPGWAARSVPNVGIDADAKVWFPTRDYPIGIDEADVANPAGTIAKPYDDVQAGTVSGEKTGAIGATDEVIEDTDVRTIDPPISIPKPSPKPKPTPTPVIPIVPTITAQRLYTVHSVSQSELNALGAYLWSSDFISLIENMFNEPIDAVIGLHTLYYGSSLPLGSSETIKLGAISATGCTGTRVTNQYTNIDCGSVAIPEYWHNAEDYAPYTDAEIFLPFIGFRKLDINEIMGGSVYLKYGIDIYTGACVAMIGVMRDGISQMLYSYEGNCAVQQPVTSADYSRIIGGILSAGVGIATGGVGAAVGIAGALTSHKINYSRSGNFSANAGASMPKTPYIIISRPMAYDAPSYSHFYGYPANWTVTLGSCSGFTRVKDVHLDQIACTDVEKEEILTMLKAGVIL